MNILIAGASGLIGSELTHTLAAGHQITVLGRSVASLQQLFPENITKLSWDKLENHDAASYDLIINLAGSNIGSKRWNATVKRELIESRTLTNQQLTEWLIKYQATPRYFCANAIGIYGPSSDKNLIFDEDSPLPASSSNFLQHIGLVWEQSLQRAKDAGIPVTITRFGVVLNKKGGMLQKLVWPFRLGLGSTLGNGEQPISWIHHKDLIKALFFLIEHPELTGAINITSPYPVTQKQFAQLFAQTLKRPLLLKTPSWLIQLLFGEMGMLLLLEGQSVMPKRLLEQGFKFDYPQLKAALAEEFT